MEGYSFECRLALGRRDLVCRTSCSVYEEVEEYEEIDDAACCQSSQVVTQPRGTAARRASLSPFARANTAHRFPLQERARPIAATGDCLEEWGQLRDSSDSGLDSLLVEETGLALSSKGAFAAGDDASTEDGTNSHYAYQSLEDRGSIASADDRTERFDLASCGASLDGLSDKDTTRPTSPTETETTRPTTPALSTECTDAFVPAIPMLAGVWRLSRTEGNMDALMADAGYSWGVRRMAQGVNYGVGLSSLDIKQEGDRINITFITALTNHSSELSVGSGEQETFHEDGTPMIAVPWWQGEALIVESRRKDNGIPMQPAKRYLEAEELVVESSTSNGDVVKRFYGRAEMAT